MINFLTACDSAGTLKIILFIKYLVNIVFIAVPIGLIAITTVDVIKSVTAGQEENQKKNTAIIIKRIISCVALFLVPTIINIAFNIMVEAKIEYATCWIKANANIIKELETKDAEDKLAIAVSNPTSKNIQEAETAINQVTDDDARKSYQEQLDKIKKEIQDKAIAERDAKEKDNKKKNIVSNGETGSGDSKVEIKQIDSISKESCPNAYKVYNRLITKHNLSREVASAMVGNFFKESGGDGTHDLNPATKTVRSTGTSGGIAGFTDNSNSGAKGFTELNEFAASQGKEWTDIDVQTDLIMKKANTKWHWQEVNIIGSVTRLRDRGFTVITDWDEFLKLTNLETATISFLGVYEDCIYEKTAKAYHYEFEDYVKYETSTRVSLAKAVYDAFG